MNRKSKAPNRPVSLPMTLSDLQMLDEKIPILAADLRVYAPTVSPTAIKFGSVVNRVERGVFLESQPCPLS